MVRLHEQANEPRVEIKLLHRDDRVLRSSGDDVIGAKILRPFPETARPLRIEHPGRPTRPGCQARAQSFNDTAWIIGSAL